MNESRYLQQLMDHSRERYARMNVGPCAGLVITAALAGGFLAGNAVVRRFPWRGLLRAGGAFLGGTMTYLIRRAVAGSLLARRA